MGSVFAAGSLGQDLYDRPGRTRVKRQIGYRALSGDACDAGLKDELRAATNGGWALDDPRFKREIANARGRRDAPLPGGTADASRRRRLAGKSNFIPL